MRILQVARFYPPYVGGTERIIRDISRGLGAEHRIRVLACNPARGTVIESLDGVEVVRAAAPVIAFSTPLSLGFFSWYARLQRNADLVHFHHPFPLADLAVLIHGTAGKRVVVSYHSEVVRQKWAMPVYAPLNRRLLARADRILVSSARLRDRSSPLQPFREKCTVVPFGVEPGAPTPAGDYVLFVGRLVAYKGVDILIRAMAGLAAPLVVAGDGPERARLERLASAMRVCVRFVGRVSDDRLRGILQRSRFLVLPSVAATETFGLVQLDALAAGRPVINTDLPTGVPDVSPDGITGLTVPPRDVAALAGAIRTLWSNPEMQVRFSRNASERARVFSMERFVDGIRRVYRELGVAP